MSRKHTILSFTVMWHARNADMLKSVEFEYINFVIYLSGMGNWLLRDRPIYSSVMQGTGQVFTTLAPDRDLVHLWKIYSSGSSINQP